MEIVRNGIEIELTRDEMRQAYDVIDKEYRIEDIKSQIAQMENTECIEDDDMNELLLFVDHTLGNNDSYWSSYWSSLEYAIEEYVKRKEAKQCN